jgi:hypothetical protein
MFRLDEVYRIVNAVPIHAQVSEPPIGQGRIWRYKLHATQMKLDGFISDDVNYN